jgi:hypothetical protein
MKHFERKTIIAFDELHEIRVRHHWGRVTLNTGNMGRINKRGVDVVVWVAGRSITTTRSKPNRSQGRKNQSGESHQVLLDRRYWIPATLPAFAAHQVANGAK